MQCLLRVNLMRSNYNVNFVLSWGPASAVLLTFPCLICKMNIISSLKFLCISIICRWGVFQLGTTNADWVLRKEANFLCSTMENDTVSEIIYTTNIFSGRSCNSAWGSGVEMDRFSFTLNLCCRSSSRRYLYVLAWFWSIFVDKLTQKNISYLRHLSIKYVPSWTRSK